MLLIDDGSLVPILGTSGSRCSICTKPATWKGTTKAGARDTPMCAWCVLYGGSAWGHKNHEEILGMGIQIRQAALASKNKKVNVPELDERHRLGAMDAEKLMLGVGYCSEHLRPKLAGLLRGSGD